MVTPTKLSRAVPTKGPFSRGGAGAILTCIGSIPMAGGLLLCLSSFLRYNSIVYILILIGSLVLLVGFILGGMGFEGFYRNYGSTMGLVAYLFSLFAPLILLISGYLGMAPQSSGWGYYYSYYSQPTDPFIFWGGLIVLGVMLILWGAACIQVKKFTRSANLLLTAGIIYIVAGSFIISFILAFVGFILMFVAGIITAAGFFGYTMADVVFSYILKHGGEIRIPECAKELGAPVREIDSAIGVLIEQGRIEYSTPDGETF